MEELDVSHYQEIICRVADAVYDDEGNEDGEFANHVIVLMEAADDPSHTFTLMLSPEQAQQISGMEHPMNSLEMIRFKDWLREYEGTFRFLAPPKKQNGPIEVEPETLLHTRKLAPAPELDENLVVVREANVSRFGFKSQHYLNVKGKQ